MNKVLAHTSKVGWHVQKQMSYWYTTLEGTNKIIWDSTAEVTTGLSFKSPISYSDGHKPTAYSRIIMRAVGGPIDRSKQGYGRQRGDNSFFSSGLKMNTLPWGQLSLSSGSVSPPAHLRLSAISRAVAKLHGQQSFILEDLAQSAQTARQVYDLFKGIIRSTGKYLAVLYQAISFWESNHGVPSKRGGPKRHRSSIDDMVRKLAKAWLAWYYGIKPLISTINSIGRAEKPRYKTIKAKAKATEQLDPSGLYGMNPIAKLSFTFSGECKAETTCELLCDCTMSTNIAALARLGFRTATDPFSDSQGDDYGNIVDDASVLLLGWALLPYSFVIDWIIPVESFLSTLTWSPNLRYKGGYITDYMGGTSRCIEKDANDGWTGQRENGRVEAILFQRETYHDYPPPATLAVNQSISPVNSANAAALLLNIFR